MSTFNYALFELYTESPGNDTTDAFTRTNETTDNLAKQLNDEFRNAVLPVAIFVGLEVFFGFFGNLIVLFVFLLRYPSCNFRYFVLCLALTDILSSLTTMPGEMLTQMNWYSYRWEKVCKTKSFFNMFTVCAESLCLLTIAIDRYRKVCEPLRWQIRPRTAMYLCLGIYLCALLFSIPVPVFWGLHSYQTQYNDVEINVTICEKDQDFKDTNSVLIYSVTMETTLSVILFTMLVLYAFVVKKLLSNKRFHHSTKYPQIIITTSTDSPAEVTINQSDFSDTGCSSSADKRPVGIKTHKSKSNHNKSTSNLTLKVPIVTKSHTGVLNSNDSDLTDMESEQSSVDTDTKQGSTQNRDVRQCCEKTITYRKKIGGVSMRIKRKTLIMFILTVIFIITTILYLTLLIFISMSDNVLQSMSHKEKATYFFFFRLYFVNHVINPIVYGILDPRFKEVLRNSIGNLRK